MPEPIEEGWVAYRGRTLDPIRAGSTQVEETRKSFYFGAIWMFQTLVAGVSGGDEPTAADMALMDRVKLEMDEFLRRMRPRGSG